LGGAVRWKRIGFVALLGLVCSACATSPPASPGRVGDLRGRIAHVEKEQGLIAVAAESDAAERWFTLAPLTAVRGPNISSVDALEAGQRVYVRYLRGPGTDPPELLSITVIRYTLRPQGEGSGSFEIPGL